MTAISTNRVDQTQKLPFAIDAEMVNPEKGFLNGKEVTIQEIDPKDFIGIQISADKYETLPKSIRPVKIAFKDFRQWFSKCRPVKGLKHLVMGKGKRMVKKQNWGKISEPQAEKALKATDSEAKKQILAEKINEFNSSLETLSQKKKDINEFKGQNDEFREKYKTILAVVDGDVSSLRKGSVIVLPPVTKGGEPQLVVLNSKSERVRKSDVKKLADIFMESKAYTDFVRNVNRVYQVEGERSKLKSLLADQAKNLKKEHKDLISERAAESKAVLATQQKEEQALTIKTLVDDIETKYLKKIDPQIEAKIAEVDELNKEIKKYQQVIGETHGVIPEIEARLNIVEEALVSASNAEANLTGEAVKIMNLDGEQFKAFNEERDSLLEEINAKRIEIEEAEGKLKEVEGNYMLAMEDLQKLNADKNKQLKALDNHRKKIQKDYDDVALKISKEYDREVKNEQKAVTKMLSGSGFKKKDTAQPQTAQPQNDQENNPEA
ncbi:hypothetical protein [Endozoicomonas sp. GU-1]|uniref:hypothetical protein n=1 Tax=Endozoicomonas sp. GU-1 TaxID=3009078 RepID=UPI0022B30DED|nr:hypothetical protein [Endozoicomonas sp. GU-1]WBA83081.1 hypothetical protein O2T12_08185 [Endozoicomonas sp. GU-1]WBA86005.1 hypothetical protein O3276_22820 [Endozoicomonas sp. GU-1]